MLPTHRTPPPSESLARLVKNRQPLSKFVLRWILLGCAVLTLVWFAGPLVLGLLRPAPIDFNYPLVDIPSPPPPHGRPHRPPQRPPSQEDKIWEPRKQQVREAFLHAWLGYKEHAYPADELLAITGGKSNKYNGWGVTLYDSLDTMWIMGLKEEFEEAVSSIADKNFTATRPDHYAPFFETTIRYLGGTLSAYALSGNKILLDHADELGRLLIPAFHGTESGLPAYSVHVETGKILADQNKRTVLFAEATTCQLEFKYLAKITGNKEYYERVQTAMNLFYKANVENGLFHDSWLMKDGSPSGNHFTIGATADSGYEYLLKQWLLSGDPDARTQYIRSVNGIINNLIGITPTRGILYVGDLVNGRLIHRLEHLSCYLPGLMALGAHTLDLPAEEKELHLWAAQGLGYTCAISYADQASGLGPDEMQMPPGNKWIDEVRKWKKDGRVGKPPGLREPPAEKDSTKRDYSINWPHAYLLRPETVESIFYLWRTTGDVRWRERGYGIFQAIDRHTRTKFGFASVHGVDGEPRQLDDMPSWFLAETLKYLYLLFDDTDAIPLSKYVFNTEAHPLPVFTWTEEERAKFNVDGLTLHI